MEQKKNWKLAGDGLSTIFWANVAALVSLVIMVPVMILMLFGIDLKGGEIVLAAFGTMLAFGAGAMNLLALLSMRRAHRLYAMAWNVVLAHIGLAVVPSVILAITGNRLDSVLIERLTGVLSAGRDVLLLLGTNRLLEEPDELDSGLMRLSKWVLTLLVVSCGLRLLPAEWFGAYKTVWETGAELVAAVFSIAHLIYLRDAARRLLRAAGEA